MSEFIKSKKDFKWDEKWKRGSAKHNCFSAYCMGAIEHTTGKGKAHFESILKEAENLVDKFPWSKDDE